MSKTVRALLLWCLALAIPLQGMATVVMPLCSAMGSTSLTTSFMGHPLALTAAAQTQTQASHAEHAMHHGMAHEVGHDSTQAGAQPEVNHDGHDGHTSHGMLKCCSATGSLAVLSNISLPAQGMLPMPAPLASTAQLPAGVIPDGLDRPPQDSLA